MSNGIASQPHNLPLHVTAETCRGGVYIITGANTGLGLEAARHLVRLRAARVILAVRSLPAGEAAQRDIEADTGVTGVAEVWELDLARYESVKAFAARAAAELERIDALVENAGVAMSQRVYAEGHLVPVTVNVLSTLLLAVLLLPKMEESARTFGILPHVAIVSSGASFDVGPDWELIKDDPLVKIESEETVMMKTYPLTKLMEIMAVKEVARLLPVAHTGVVLNLVCPGLCKTELSRNAPADFRANLSKMHEQFGRTAEDGSRTLLHGAVAGKDSHGCLLQHCAIAEDSLPAFITDEAGRVSQKRTWDVVAAELETIVPGCTKRVLEA